MTRVHKAQSYIFLRLYNRSNISEAISLQFPSYICTEAAELVTSQEGWSPRTAMEDTQAIKLVTGSIQTTVPAARGINATLKLWNRCCSWQRNKAAPFTSTIFLYEYKSQKHLCWKLPLTSNFSPIIPQDEVQMRSWIHLYVELVLAENVMHWHLYRRTCKIDLLPVTSKIKMMREMHCGFGKWSWEMHTKIITDVTSSGQVHHPPTHTHMEMMGLDDHWYIHCIAVKVPRFSK